MRYQRHHKVILDLQQNICAKQKSAPTEHATAKIGYTERLAQHRRAVITLAHQSARRAIKRQFQAQGVRLHDLTARKISIWAQAWFDIATWPEFARWRRPVSPSDSAKAAIDLTR